MSFTQVEWPKAKKLSRVREIGYLYQIVSIDFRQGSRKIVFRVKQLNTGQVIKFSALDIYYDDALLEKFKPSDIREIVYVAAWELFLAERNFLNKPI